MAEIAPTIELERDRDPLDQLVEAFLDGLQADLGNLDTVSHVPGALAEFQDFRRNDLWLRQLAGSRPVKRGPGAARAGTDPAAGAEALSESQFFGDYELLGELGRGGMGVVYKARQRSLDRIVALKMITAGRLASSAEVQRFRTEARLAAQLDHVGIVPVHAVGEHEGQHFYSIAFIEGASVQDLIASGTVLNGRDAADLVRPVAEAIHYAHTHGVIHRDLKPANILLAPSHRDDALRLPNPDDRPVEPKITDFGLGKMTKGGSELTGSGQIVGTPSYMSPEQASARAHEVGPLSDVYSLGALLYCLLVGRPPFRAASPLETLKQVVEDSPVPLRRVNSAIPRDLETICHKCLEKNPQRRYASAWELADDLRRFRNGEPIAARPASAVEKAAKWIRRHPARAGLLLASLLTLMALAGVLVGLRYQGELQRLLASRRVLLAYEAWRDRDFMMAQQLLDEVPEDVRGWEWWYVDRLCRARLIRTIGQPGAVTARRSGIQEDRSPILVWHTTTGSLKAQLPLPLTNTYALGLRFSADSKQLSAATYTQEQLNSRWDPTTLPADGAAVFRRWNLADSQLVGEPTRGLDDAWSWGRVAYSNDGTLVAVQPSMTLYGWAFREDDIRNALNAAVDPTRLEAHSGSDPAALIAAVQARHGQGIAALARSPDQQRLASAGHDGLIALWDVSSGEHLFDCDGHSRRVLSLRFSPNGLRLASGDENGVVRLWDVLTGRLMVILDRQPRTLYGLAFHPRGDQLAVADASFSLKLWDIGRDTESTALQGHQGPVLAIAFDPQGRWLAAGGEDGRITLWRPDTQMRLGDLQAHEGAVTRLAFSPDGHLLASSSHDRSVKLWNVHAAEVEKLPVNVRHQKQIQILNEHRTLSGHQDIVFGISFSPDGQWLSSVGRDGQSLLWNVATGSIQQQHQHAAGPMYCTAIDPRGKRIVFGGYELAISDLELDRMVLFGDQQYQEVRSVAFSPDGSRLAEAGRDGIVRVWNLRFGPRLVATLLRNQSLVSGLAFTPDGDRLASASYDGSVIIWDPESGHDTLVLKGPTGRVYDLAFSPDGRLLATANQDGTITLWGH